MFYVYVYKDPRPTKHQQVVYVGKGTEERMYAHWRSKVHRNRGFGAFLALLRKMDLQPIIEKVADYKDEAEAFAEEMRLIALYGRRDLRTGTLFNLTDGGEGFSGVVRTDTWCENISAALSTSESVARNRQAALRNWADSDYRARVTEAIKVALRDPEVIARREAGKAAFVHTDEFRDTMRQATAKMWSDPTYAARVAEGQRAVQGTPEARQRKSVNSKRMWEDKGDAIAEKIRAGRSTEVSREKTRRQSRAQWGNPEYAAKQTANNREIANRPEVKAAKSAASKAMWADPEKRAKLLAARRRKKNLPTPLDSSHSA